MGNAYAGGGASVLNVVNQLVNGGNIIDYSKGNVSCECQEKLKEAWLNGF